MVHRIAPAGISLAKSAMALRSRSTMCAGGKMATNRRFVSLSGIVILFQQVNPTAAQVNYSLRRADCKCLSPGRKADTFAAMSLRTELENSGSWLFRHRTYLPLLLIPVFFLSLESYSYLDHRRWVNEVWQGVCIAVSVLGLLVRIITVGRAPIGTSGRNTREQVANTLNTTGIYSVVRHPLYLGNFLIMLGFSMWPHNAWLVALTVCVYALYYERIMLAEEAFLRGKFGETFEKWSSQTPAFIPRLGGWKPSPVPFCWRTVAQREYNSFFQIIYVFFLFDLIGDSIADQNWHLDYVWFGVFLAGFVIFAVLRTLKKRTKIFDVEGR